MCTFSDALLLLLYFPLFFFVNAYVYPTNSRTTIA